MKVKEIIDDEKYLNEYIKLCFDEWGNKQSNFDCEKYVEEKKNKIKNGNKVLSVLGLINDEELIGFISLFRYDGEERKDLTPWYATMYVKKEYRGKGYSKILNDAILKEANKMGFDKLYLKTDLNDYYEKYGAIYIDTLLNGEKLYYIKTK